MRIRRVDADSFGGLVGERLELADGLTVIYGPNEAGKSTWHAAALAALCGRPATGRDGLDRYAPWSSGEWAVRAEIALADGRRIEMRHDLAARHGWATDLDLGTDCAAEITAKGRGEVPDAARWLGLDRRAFVATACVRQSDLRLATEQADGIRGYVERAAATAPGEETAAAALAVLERFQRENTGTDRTTTKPLQVARRAVADASAEVRAAVSRRDEIEAASAHARDLRAAAGAVAARLARSEAAVARGEARRLGERAARARELAGAAVDLTAAPPPSSRPRRAVVLTSIGALAIAGGAAMLVAGLAPTGVAALAGGLLLTIVGLADLRRRAPSGPVREWLAAREAQIARRAGLEALLEGGTVDDLVARSALAAQRAELLTVAAGSTVDDHGAGDIDELRRALAEAERHAALAEQVVALSREQTPVADAEEALAQATAEQARLEELDDVLARTRGYLERAQARVYRDIAPRLATGVGRDLARVTAGRYTEAFVDPRSLAVRVRGDGGVPRDADRLSVGAAEQVYLLLRVALAEHLVRPGESCPLLLDDVTVHADESRTAQILEVLLAVAARHQVVLFTQQEQVRGWAAARLDGGRHALRELTAPVAP